MGSSKIKPCKNGISLNRLTDQQRSFVVELLADDFFNSKEAAKRAGYKNPGPASHKLLNNPLIQRALGKAQREREERCELKADDVWNYLRTALFFNPLQYFSPGPDGGWTISDPQELPEEIGRLIESMKIVQKTSTDGETETNTFEVKFVSKTEALKIAMKHCSPNEQELKVIHSFDWDALDQPPERLEFDEIEQAILDIERVQ